MSNELLEAVKEANQNYINRDINENGMDERDAMNIGFFMQHCLNLLENIINRQEQLFSKVKKLEQAKTFFPMTEGKHRALLNNCVDDDEAVLHEREIKEVKG